MRRLAVLVGLPVAAIVLFALAERRAFTTVAGAGVAGESTSFTHEELRDFSYLNPIDTHTHIYKDDPAYTSMLQKLHLHILDIVDVSDNGDPERKSLDKEERDVFAVARDSHDRAAVCTSFDPFRINDPNFGSAAIARLNESFSRGAIAVKLWKNIGMEIKDTHGNYVLPDQPVRGLFTGTLRPDIRPCLPTSPTPIRHGSTSGISRMPVITRSILNGTCKRFRGLRPRPTFCWHATMCWKRILTYG